MKKLVIVMLSLAFGTAAAEQGEYVLHGKPEIGSHIPAVLGRFDVPLDVPYDKMSAAQQAVVRKGYGELPANIHPPFPTHGNEALFRDLLEGNRKYGDHGEVMAIATINSKGDVVNIEVFKSPSSRVTRMVTRALARTEFSPGVCQGKPCASEYLFTLNFDRI